LADVREPCGVSDVEVDVEQDDVEANVANYPGDAGEPKQEVVQDLAEFKLKYVDSITSFYLMLQGKYLVPVSTIAQIVDELTMSHELEQEYSISLLRNTLNLYKIPNQNVDENVDTLVRDNIFNVTQRKDTGILRSDHMRQKYYREHFHVVDPVHLQLGHDKYNKQATCHYIPIKDTIRALYHNTFVSRQFESPLLRDPGSLSDVMDGTTFQSNAFFSDNSSALKIILFQDAFEIVNPLGSAKKKRKILGVYFTSGRFSPPQSFISCSDATCNAVQRELL